MPASFHADIISTRQCLVCGIATAGANKTPILRKPRPDRRQTGIMMTGQADNTRKLDHQPPDKPRKGRTGATQPGLPAFGTPTALAVAGEYRS
jgi:hypothetical protein